VAGLLSRSDARYLRILLNGPRTCNCASAAVRKGRRMGDGGGERERAFALAFIAVVLQLLHAKYKQML